MKKVIPGDPPRRGGEAHVVAFQRVGDYQLVAPLYPPPIGQIIVVAVRKIGKGTSLREQSQGVGRASPGIPAARSHPHHLCMQLYGFGDGGALVGFA